ncbi:FHA domain-containing protein [Dyella koreensis]|uniref:FHA domain-containing protein n=1 Tax=Dyella koreensis TaxID=311235 RepID=A0ABW8JZX9_9GAMM
MSALPTTRHRPPSSPPKVQLALRVFSGLHAGAELRLPQRGILMIGQADDCDLILGDANIANHHCVLTVMGDQVLLRAMDGEVETHDGHVAVGENVSLEHFAMVRLGDVQFAVGPHWSERWQTLADAADAKVSALTERQLAGRRRGVLVMAGLLLAVAGLVLIGSWKVTHPTVQVRSASVADQLDKVRGVLRGMSLMHVSANSGEGGRLIVRGVVGNAAQLPELKRRLSDAGLVTELTVRDWPSVEKQVNDIFAMHGYTVETKLLDQGGVEVGGHFGDIAKAERVQKDVLGSSDMQNLNTDALGLTLALKNYDERTPEPVKPDPGKRIRHVVSGREPYLITRDESRYYPGNLLPQGGVFLNVSAEGSILMRMPDNRYMQLNKQDDYQVPQPLDDAAASVLLPPANPAAVASAAAPVDAAEPMVAAKHRGNGSR